MKAKKKYAERFAGVTSKNRGQLEDRHRKALRIFSTYRFEKILDVGCGDGNFSILLKEACKAKEVYGIEISERCVESAIENGVKAFQLDIDEEDFPFVENYFDAVSAEDVIEHLYDPDHLLDEVHRTLKPDGIVVLSTPNLASIYNRIALFFGYQPFNTNVSSRIRIGHITEEFSLHKTQNDPVCIREFDHIRLFTYRTLLEFLRFHNFEVLGTYGCRASTKPIGFSRLFSMLETSLSGFSSGAHGMMMVATKRDVK